MCARPRKKQASDAAYLIREPVTVDRTIAIQRSSLHWPLAAISLEKASSREAPTRNHLAPRRNWTEGMQTEIPCVATNPYSIQLLCDSDQQQPAHSRHPYS